MRSVFIGILLVFFSNAAGAQTRAVDLEARAERFVRQVELTWVPKKLSYERMLETQKNTQKIISEMAANSKVNLDKSCPDSLKSQDEKTLSNAVQEVNNQLKVAGDGELKTHDYWQGKYSEIDAMNTDPATGLSIFGKVVMSKARAKMLVAVYATFKAETAYLDLRLINSCQIRALLQSRGIKSDAASALREIQGSFENNTRNGSRNFYSTYSESLQAIIGMQ